MVLILNPFSLHAVAGYGDQYEILDADAFNRFVVPSLAPVDMRSAASSSSSGGQVIYSLIVGPIGTANIDYVVSNAADLQTAFNALNSTGTIFVKNGVYVMSEVTVPARIDLVFDSSAVWVNGNGSKTMVTNYGKIRGPKFDMNGTGLAAQSIVVKTKSQMTGFEIYNATGMAKSPTNNTYQFCILCVQKSSDFVLQGEMRDFIALSGAANYGDNAVFKIYDSSAGNIQVNMFPSNVEATASVGLHIARSDDIRFHNSKLDQIGGNFVTLDTGNRDIFFERNRLTLTQTAGDSATGLLLNSQMDAAGFASTGTISFSYNDVEVRTVAGNYVIGTGGGGSLSRQGLRVKNNTVSVQGVPGSEYTFLQLTSDSVGAVIQQNNVCGLSFISNAGAATLFVSQGNVVCAVEQ